MITILLKCLRFFLGISILLTFTQIAFSHEDNILLEGIDGKKHSLTKYIGKGQWVVVNVWATDCPYCRRELFDLTSFHDRHHDKDAIVLGLTLDLVSFGIPNKAYVTNFSSTYLIDYPLLLVSGEIASEVIGKPVTTVPTTFFYNPKGEMVYQLNGEVTTQILEDVIKNKKPFYREKRSKN
jgi:thiol-disulfide isomerase/thioredoxin